MLRWIVIGIKLLRERGKCFGCGEKLTKDNNSEAHVIPNALGGRLAPKKLICRKCNTEFSELADNDLVNAFGAWPTLLNIPRQNGDNPPKTLDTKAGFKVRIEADGKTTRVDPQYEENQVAAGTSLDIGAGNKKTFGQLLKRAHKKYPQFDPVEAEKHAQIISLPISEICAPINFSVGQTFGGVALCIWLFLIYRTRHAIIRKSDLRNMIATIKQGHGKLRYFFGGMPGLNGPDVPIGHKIVVQTIPSRGELIAYVEIFGALRVGGVFANSPPSMDIQPQRHIYVYDLNMKRERSSEFTIDDAVFMAQDWPNAGIDLKTTTDQQLVAACVQAMAPLRQAFDARQAKLAAKQP